MARALRAVLVCIALLLASAAAAPPLRGTPSSSALRKKGSSSGSSSHYHGSRGPNDDPAETTDTAGPVGIIVLVVIVLCFFAAFIICVDFVRQSRKCMPAWNSKMRACREDFARGWGPTLSSDSPSAAPPLAPPPDSQYTATIQQAQLRDREVSWTLSFRPDTNGVLQVRGKTSGKWVAGADEESQPLPDAYGEVEEGVMLPDERCYWVERYGSLPPSVDGLVPPLLVLVVGVVKHEAGAYSVVTSMVTNYGWGTTYKEQARATAGRTAVRQMTIRQAAVTGEGQGGAAPPGAGGWIGGGKVAPLPEEQGGGVPLGAAVAVPPTGGGTAGQFDIPRVNTP